MREDRTPPSLPSPPSASRTLLHFNYLIVANQPPPTGAPAHTQRNANVTTNEQQAVNGTPSLTRSMIRAPRPILSISTLFHSGCPGSSVVNAVGVAVHCTALVPDPRNGQEEVEAWFEFTHRRSRTRSRSMPCCWVICGVAHVGYFRTAIRRRRCS